jgi:hypothetical protein
VVLDDVADDAGLLVERRAVLDADRLADRDLDVVDVRVVPDGPKIAFANRNAKMFCTVSLPR